VVHNGVVRKVYKTLLQKHKRKKTIETYRRRWNDNIKMDFKYVECKNPG
jgi:hypothetical protein